MSQAESNAWAVIAGQLLKEAEEIRVRYDRATDPDERQRLQDRYYQIDRLLGLTRLFNHAAEMRQHPAQVDPPRPATYPQPAAREVGPAAPASAVQPIPPPVGMETLEPASNPTEILGSEPETETDETSEPLQEEGTETPLKPTDDESVRSFVDQQRTAAFEPSKYRPSPARIRLASLRRTEKPSTLPVRARGPRLDRPSRNLPLGRSACRISSEDEKDRRALQGREEQPAAQAQGAVIPRDHPALAVAEPIQRGPAGPPPEPIPPAPETPVHPDRIAASATPSRTFSEPGMRPRREPIPTSEKTPAAGPLPFAPFSRRARAGVMQARKQIVQQSGLFEGRTALRRPEPEEPEPVEPPPPSSSAAPGSAIRPKLAPGEIEYSSIPAFARPAPSFTPFTPPEPAAAPKRPVAARFDRPLVVPEPVVEEPEGYRETLPFREFHPVAPSMPLILELETLVAFEEPVKIESGVLPPMPEYVKVEPVVPLPEQGEQHSAGICKAALAMAATTPDTPNQYLEWMRRAEIEAFWVRQQYCHLRAYLDHYAGPYARDSRVLRHIQAGEATGNFLAMKYYTVLAMTEVAKAARGGTVPQAEDALRQADTENAWEGKACRALTALLWLVEPLEPRFDSLARAELDTLPPDAEYSDRMYCALRALLIKRVGAVRQHARIQRHLARVHDEWLVWEPMVSAAVEALLEVDLFNVGASQNPHRNR